jgi:hypothetical protein
MLKQFLFEHLPDAEKGNSATLSLIFAISKGDRTKDFGTLEQVFLLNPDPSLLRF